MTAAEPRAVGLNRILVPTGAAVVLAASVIFFVTLAIGYAVGRGQA